MPSNNKLRFENEGMKKDKQPHKTELSRLEKEVIEMERELAYAVALTESQNSELKAEVAESIPMPLGQTFHFDGVSHIKGVRALEEKLAAEKHEHGLVQEEVMSLREQLSQEKKRTKIANDARAGLKLLREQDHASWATAAEKNDEEEAIRKSSGEKWVVEKKALDAQLAEALAGWRIEAERHEETKQQVKILEGRVAALEEPLKEAVALLTKRAVPEVAFSDVTIIHEQFPSSPAANKSIGTQTDGQKAPAVPAAASQAPAVVHVNHHLVIEHEYRVLITMALIAGILLWVTFMAWGSSDLGMAGFGGATEGLTARAKNKLGIALMETKFLETFPAV